MTAPVRYYSYTMTANQRIRVQQSGTFVLCSAGPATFDILVDESNSLQLQEGIAYRAPTPFKSLVIVNGATAQTISLYVGDGIIDIARLYGSIDATLTPPPSCTNVADQSLDATDEYTFAASADRKRLVVQANINNTTDLRVGPTVGDSRGHVLPPGASAEFFTQAAILVRNPTGGDSGMLVSGYWETD